MANSKQRKAKLASKMTDEGFKVCADHARQARYDNITRSEALVGEDKFDRNGDRVKCEECVREIEIGEVL